MAQNSSDNNSLKLHIRELEEELTSLKKRMTERDARFDYAMEATNDGLWDWDLRTNKMYFSRSFLRMLGYDYQDLPGDLRTFRRYFLHPEDLDALEKQYQSAIDSHEYSVTSQYRLLHKEGHSIWVQTKSKFFEADETGRAWRCVGMNTDVTEYIRRHDELLSAKAQADKANRIKSEFLARINHEIRTPMNAIIGIGYLLKDTRLDEQQLSYLQSLHVAADSLLQMMNQLLDFSKIESGSVILENSHFDIFQLFEKMSRLFESSALHRKVNIHLNVDKNVPQFLRGDASRLSQILNHFVGNCFQHGNTDEVFIAVKKINLSEKNICLEFRIEDSGCGIAPEINQQIQDKINLQKDWSPKDQSTGLYICNHLIQLMQGSLAIRSQQGHGTQVIFSVNLEPSRLGERFVLEKIRNLHCLRVLVIDDNHIARTIIATTARSLHLQTDECDDAQIAWQKICAADAKNQPYHFLLVDYRMPNMDGLELTGLIKKSHLIKHRPLVCLISAMQQDEICQTSDNSQLIDAYLSKPISESRLYETISHAITQHPELELLSRSPEPSCNIFSELEQFHVLIAEDNLVNQQVLKGILRKKNIRHQIANNGREAVDILSTSQEPFDAILMDLEMPELNGIEATQAIRSGQKQADIPIIAVTAQAMRGDRDACLSAGMDGYLCKPVNPELLYQTLFDIVSSKNRASDNAKTHQ